MARPGHNIFRPTIQGRALGVQRGSDSLGGVRFGIHLSPRLHSQHDLADMGARFHAGVGFGGLGERVRALAALRHEEGYMAEARGDGDGGFLLIENHCPICAAATACQGFCRSELEVFRAALGPDVRVERSEHLLAGARRCAYRIAPV